MELCFIRRWKCSFWWEKRSWESSFEGESIKRVKAGLHLPAQTLVQHLCGTVTFRWLPLKPLSFGAPGALPDSASP